MKEKKYIVVVDELKIHHNAYGIFKQGSAHLTCDDLETLHEFALKIGLKRIWFQDHPFHPHYDLTVSRHKKALELGAVFIPARDQALKRLKKLNRIK